MDRMLRFTQFTMLTLLWAPSVLIVTSCATSSPRGETLVSAVAASAAELELALPGKWRLNQVQCSSGAPWSGGANATDLQVDLHFDGKKLIWESMAKDEKPSRVESPYAVQSHLLTFRTKKSYVTYFAELTATDRLKLISPTVWGLGGECPSKDTLIFTFSKVGGI